MGRLVVAFIVCILAGCTSMQPPEDEFGTTLSPDTYMEYFESGKLRLNCRKTSCSFGEGYYGSELKAIHRQGGWERLANRTIEIGYPSDRAYYFLGRAAEGLGFLDAALAYYKLSMNVSWSYRCGSSLICEGFKFPEDSRARIGLVEKRIKLQKALEEQERSPLI